MPQSMPTSFEQCSRPETILLVEDEELVREFVTTVLRRAGYEVLPFARPRDAIDYCSRPDVSIDAIVTDVMLGGMNARAMVAELQKHRAIDQVLYVSGYADGAVYSHGLLDPGIWFLQKPFTGASLLAKVRQLLDATVTA